MASCSKGAQGLSLFCTIGSVSEYAGSFTVLLLVLGDTEVPPLLVLGSKVLDRSGFSDSCVLGRQHRGRWTV